MPVERTTKYAEMAGSLVRSKLCTAGGDRFDGVGEALEGVT